LYINRLILGRRSLFFLMTAAEEAFMGSAKNTERSQTMNNTSRHQIDKSNEDALAAFISRKEEIDQMLARLQALSDDHFGWSPDEINWGHVGTLGHYAELLRRITDSAFNEGDHAAE
jgi:hypothetical protein